MGRTTGDFGVHGSVLTNSPSDRVRLGVGASSESAVAARHHQSRLGHRFSNALERLTHVQRGSSGYEQSVSVTWRGHEARSVLSGVIDRSEGLGDLHFAPIARAHVDMTQLHGAVATGTRRVKRRRGGPGHRRGSREEISKDVSIETTHRAHGVARNWFSVSPERARVTASTARAARKKSSTLSSTTR